MNRFSHMAHPVSQRLLSIMLEKKTNLCFSADLTKKAEILALVDQLGPAICLLKTHIDIVEEFDWAFIRALKTLAERHRFLIFEDRKFADIGNTVKYQYGAGIYKIAEWADIVNAHTVSGPGIIEGLKSVNPQLGLLLLAEMSSKGNLATGDYVQASIKMAMDHTDVVMGFVAQRALLANSPFLYMTPGVALSAHGDALGQNYVTPEAAIAKGSDILIVGRGLLTAKDPLTEAKRYQEIGWSRWYK